jgi:hypothetical protein
MVIVPYATVDFLRKMLTTVSLLMLIFQGSLFPFIVSFPDLCGACVCLTAFTFSCGCFPTIIYWRGLWFFVLNLRLHSTPTNCFVKCIPFLVTTNFRSSVLFFYAPWKLLSEGIYAVTRGGSCYRNVGQEAAAWRSCCALRVAFEKLHSCQGKLIWSNERHLLSILGAVTY